MDGSQLIASINGETTDVVGKILLAKRRVQERGGVPQILRIAPRDYDRLTERFRKVTNMDVAGIFLGMRVEQADEPTAILFGGTEPIDRENA